MHDSPILAIRKLYDQPIPARRTHQNQGGIYGATMNFDRKKRRGCLSRPPQATKFQLKDNEQLFGALSRSTVGLSLLEGEAASFILASLPSLRNRMHK